MNDIGTITLIVSIAVFVFALLVKPTSNKAHHSKC